MNFKIIAVDFDGTLFEDKWPEIGEPNKELIEYLKIRQALGDKIILWTCRCGKDLINAVEKCEKHELIFDEVNENLPEAIEKFGNNSRKIFAHEYIDDKNICANQEHWPIVLNFEVPYRIGVDVSHGKDMIGSLLNSYGEYVAKFAKNHGISVDEAHQHPMCKARLSCFNETGF